MTLSNKQIDDMRADVPPHILSLMYRIDELLATVPSEYHTRIVTELIEDAEQKTATLRARFPNYLALATAPFQTALDLYMNALLPRLSLPSRNEVSELSQHLTYI